MVSCFNRTKKLLSKCFFLFYFLSKIFAYLQELMCEFLGLEFYFQEITDFGWHLSRVIESVVFAKKK